MRLNKNLMMVNIKIFQVTNVKEKLAWLPQPGETDQDTERGVVYNTTFTGLNANTIYAFRLMVRYKSNETPYFYPTGDDEADFTYKTDGKNFILVKKICENQIVFISKIHKNIGANFS